ncbi:LysR family transcriptional regulator [Allohahella sp. A8]|uniref:LysR family transcriptional regulator n=1 Tax=Allohahella sp. A8 TaxID=3141461 RepID=UPI003A7FDB83
MQVSLQALKAFETAARRGSFKCAAEELSLTPAAISHHISNLESRLKVDLFHRKPRQITLTESGKQLSKATSEAFRLIDSALEEVAKAGSVVRVTTTSSLAAMVLIPALQELAQDCPDISVEVSTGEAVDGQSHVIPIRFGSAAEVSPVDIIRHESFDMFGRRGSKTPDWLTGAVTVFTTQWKNAALPDPPLAAWLTANGLSSTNVRLRKFDQEIFGIQQALEDDGLVFCSTTLVTRLLNNNHLQRFGTRSVESELCYYVPDKKKLDTRNAVLFLNWIQDLLNPKSGS